MALDLVYLAVLLLAAYQGYKKGFIVGVFSFFAVLTGLAAAVKLSAYVAVKLGEVVNFSEKILPLISFILVFIGVIFLVRIVALMIEKLIESMMLGMLNKLGGILIYLALYTIVFSIGLFYLYNLNILPNGIEEESTTFPFIYMIGPNAMEAIGYVIPFFSNMFEELKLFFGKLEGN